jgi:hypothetical protein
MEKAELIVGREYSKGDQRQALYVRMVTGGDITGDGMFRFETWKNNQEDVNLRIESGNTYDMQRSFVMKLLDLNEDGWKREGIRDGEPDLKKYRHYFEPELL